jgi:two-component system, NarL family, response regulator LiaR
MSDYRLTKPDEGHLRVMVVDDHDPFRSGLHRLLDEQHELEVVADARCGEDAVQQAAELCPDVAVVDVNMLGMSGIEATRGILEAAPDSAVLMLTVSNDDEAVLDAVLAGAAGYLLKDATLPEIVRGIRAAAAGHSLIAPAVAGSLLARLRFHGPPNAPPTAITELSPRELDVLHLIVDGRENSDVATRLHISSGTVKHHLSSILDKLHVDNRTQAAVLAVRLGLVDAAGRAAAPTDSGLRATTKTPPRASSSSRSPLRTNRPTGRPSNVMNASTRL